MHLAEAETLAANGSTPNACVHSAYYAMHHCGRAALLKTGGVGKTRDVPDSHEHVIRHFGILEGGAGEADSLGMLLNRARGERVVSDYGLVDHITDEQANETALNARHFVEECRKRWDLS